MRFGTDGVRGVANVELTAEFALALGRAAGRVLGARTAVIGGDSRRSTAMIDAALVAGLTAEGVDVVRLGLVPTPAVAHHAARLEARGVPVIGVMVSASHNPHRDNGVKLFAPGGLKLPDRVEREIEAALAEPPSIGGEPGAVFDASTGPDHVAHLDAYVEHLLGALAGGAASGGLAGLPVVVDAANGAASELAGPVFERAGADVTVIHAEPDGRNINDGCGATEPASLAAEVRRRGAALGLALDGDADRLIAVDELGRVVDGDHVIAICAGDLRARGRLRHDTVVTTVMANLGFRHAMEAAGITVVETPVGDRYVLEELERGGYALGGEQSGHIIFRDLATTGDGLLTGLVLADVVARDARPLSAIADAAMTRLPQVLLNVTVPGTVAERRAESEALRPEIEAAEAELGADGRVLVRSSGTEPIVRVMVEATDEAVAHRVASGLAVALERSVQGTGPTTA